MGGEIEWSALPVVVELLGVADVEVLIAQLVTIRDHHKSGDSGGG
jgi:hypothetical protein